MLSAGWSRAASPRQSFSCSSCVKYGKYDDRTCVQFPVQQWCLSLRVTCLQRVRTSQIWEAPLGASVPAATGAHPRNQLAARSSALVWELRQCRQHLLQAHRQYERLRLGLLETVGKRTQSGRKAAPRPDVSLCFSLVRAPAASACEAPAKNPPKAWLASTWRLCTC